MCSGLKRMSLTDCCEIGIFDPRIPFDYFIGLESMRFVKCSGCVNLFSNPTSRVMHNLKDLYMKDMTMLQEVIAKDEGEQTNSKVTLFPQLKVLQLSNLSKMQQFCHMSHGVELPSLEVLRIESCDLVETFSRNQVKPASDTNFIVQSFFDESHLNGLQRVDIFRCDKLRSIFSPPMFRGLINLQVLKIYGCPMLEEVIPEKEKEPQFRQLKELVLDGLPKIIGFCHIKGGLDLPSLEILTIRDCSSFKIFCTIETSNLPEDSCHNAEQQFFFHPKVRCSGLKKFTVQGMSCNIGLLDSRIPVGNFIGLESLHFENCSGFVNLFPSSKWKAIPNLKHLCVSKCEMLQEVIAMNEEEQTSSKVTLFPQLEKLELLFLQRIQQFCHLNLDLEFPSLEELTIESCLLMETFDRNPINLLPSLGVFDSNTAVDSFFVEVTCSKLKQLKLDNVEGAIELFGRRISIGNFSGLETLDICGCKRLRSIFSPGIFRDLVNLRVLKVGSCPMLQEVISKDVNEGETVTVKETLFPQLDELELSSLPKLIRFCHFKNDIELPSLDWVFVSSCPVLETFSLGSVHLPSSIWINPNYLESVKGLSPENFASQFSNNKQAVNITLREYHHQPFIERQ